MDGWTDGGTDGETHGRADGQTDGRTDGSNDSQPPRRRRRRRLHQQIAGARDVAVDGDAAVGEATVGVAAGDVILPCSRLILKCGT
jgi:hypothetical protein